MAIVTFHRRGDAAVAKAKYDGKYVDQVRRFIYSTVFLLSA